MSTDELPGMPPGPLDGTPLGEAAKAFATKKEQMATLKLDMAEIEKTVLAEMKAAGVPKIVISVGGENYEFEVVGGEDSLRCAKITKTPKKKEKEPEKEPAAA